MRYVGFSTGAIARGDFRHALEVLSGLQASAIELSALRFTELHPLVNCLDELELSRYDYVSFHAPSKFTRSEEQDVISCLLRVRERGWPIIVHPDSMHERQAWRQLGQSLCFENMDKRKPIGRTIDELDTVFRDFPDAGLCFDLGHAHQVDRTMTEAVLIAQRYRGMVRQIHISEVNSRCEHVAISGVTEIAFATIVNLIDNTVPVIIESVVAGDEIPEELARVKGLFDGSTPRFIAHDWVA